MRNELITAMQALANVEQAVSINKVSKSQIEDLHAGLQSEILYEAVCESVAAFSPSIFSNTPSSISVSEAKYFLENNKDKIIRVSKSQEKEDLKEALKNITEVLNMFKYAAKFKDIDVEKLDAIKKYYNQSHLEFVRSGGTTTTDITSEFIPFNVSSYGQQDLFKNLSKDLSSYARDTIFSVIENNKPFYPFLNWLEQVFARMQDLKWEDVIWQTPEIKKVDITKLLDAIVDGRLEKILLCAENEIKEKLSWLSTSDATNAISAGLIGKSRDDEYEEAYAKKCLDKLSYLSIFLDRQSIGILSMFKEILFTKNKKQEV